MSERLDYEDYRLREASGFQGHAGRPGQRGGSAHNPPPPGVEPPEEVNIVDAEGLSEEHIRPARKQAKGYVRPMQKQAGNDDQDYWMYGLPFDDEYYYGSEYDFEDFDEFDEFDEFEPFSFSSLSEPLSEPLPEPLPEPTPEPTPEPVTRPIDELPDEPVYAEAPSASDAPRPRRRRPRGPRTPSEIEAERPFEFEKYAGKYQTWPPGQENLNFPITGGVWVTEDDGTERYFSSPEQADNYYREYNLAQAEQAQMLARPSFMQRFVVSPTQAIGEVAQQLVGAGQEYLPEFLGGTRTGAKRPLSAAEVQQLQAQAPEEMPPHVIRPNQTVAVFHPDGTTSYFEDVQSAYNYYGAGPQEGDTEPVRLGTPVERPRPGGPMPVYQPDIPDQVRSIMNPPASDEPSIMPDTSLGRIGATDFEEEEVPTPPGRGTAAQEIDRAHRAAQVIRNREERTYASNERALRDATRRVRDNALRQGYSEDKARELANNYYRRRAEEEYRRGRIRRPRFLESVSYQDYREGGR